MAKAYAYGMFSMLWCAEGAMRVQNMWKLSLCVGVSIQACDTWDEGGSGNTTPVTARVGSHLWWRAALRDRETDIAHPRFRPQRPRLRLTRCAARWSTWHHPAGCRPRRPPASGRGTSQCAVQNQVMPVCFDCLRAVECPSPCPPSLQADGINELSRPPTMRLSSSS